MDDTTTLMASCLCGDCKFQVDVPTSSLPLDAHLCHCNLDRHTHGTLCVYHAFVPMVPSLEGMTPYKVIPTSEVVRYFCTTCGTHMGDTTEKRERWCLSTGVVDKSETIFQFKNHVFVSDTKDGGLSGWLPEIEGERLKYWEGHSGESTELDPPIKNEISDTFTKSDRLHVYCQCRGVDFYISRPDYNSPAFIADFPDMPTLNSAPRNTQEEMKYDNWWIATDRAKYVAENCACPSCRLAAGCDIVQGAFVPTCFITQANGSPYANIFGTMKEYNSSGPIWRRFCGICGATVFRHDIGERPKYVSVAVGLMDADSGSRAEEWLEWRTGELNHLDMALNNPLATAVQDGARAWSKRTGQSSRCSEGWGEPNITAVIREGAS
ncbi:hypothetical protein EJ08DRAFT_587461 [Tothia fuscella]|uniref:CENP-V/GFA domain-containing protein n=1 Tax=Tothia fuscella TaxID=1048955 RepID=A0A9P4NSK7_9PEZI|nr:hypothetical protein EJ08DRAFT_587461 [Tothia fuscella]